MTELYTVCPYCGDTLPADAAVCPACQESLAGLIRLEKRHLMLYNEAIDAAHNDDLDGAELVLRMCLRVKEDFGPAARLLAKVYAKQERWAEARAAVVQAQALLPEDTELAEFLAEIDAIEQAEKESERLEAQVRALDRREAGEDYLEAEQRDVAAAFGAGAAAVSLFVFIVGMLRGGRD